MEPDSPNSSPCSSVELEGNLNTDIIPARLLFFFYISWWAYFLSVDAIPGIICGASDCRALESSDYNTCSVLLQTEPGILTWHNVQLSRPAVSGRTRGCSCQCAAYKGLDDEGGATSPERSQLVQPSFKYKRVMLKISGEALEGDHEFGIDPKVLQRIAKEVAEVSRSGVEVAIVVGGTNISHSVLHRS